MSNQAIQYSSNPLDARLTDSITIDEQNQPSQPALTPSPNVAHVIGDFPWGPINKCIRITRKSDLVKTFFGFTSNSKDFGGFRALHGKDWGILEIVRVANDSDSYAELNVNNTSTDLILTLQAKYKGKAGNEIKARITNVAEKKYTLNVKWGAHLETFNLEFESGILPKIDSDLVTIKTAGSATDLTQENEDWQSLTGGTTGDLQNIDWIGSESDPKGLKIALQGSDGGVWFGAEHTSAAWRVELLKAVTAKRAIGVIQAEGDKIAKQVEFATSFANDRLIVTGPYVMQFFDGKLVKVDTAAFAASILVNIPPNLSMAEDRWAQKYLNSIQGIADNQILDWNNWIDATRVGLNLLEARETGGWRFHSSLTSDPADDKKLILRRRMTDYVKENIAQALAPWRNKTMLAEHRLGAYTAIVDRLKLMLGTNKTPDAKMIKNFKVTESFSDPTSIEYTVSVQLYGEIRFLIAHVTVGENVIIKEDKEG